MLPKATVCDVKLETAMGHITNEYYLQKLKWLSVSANAKILKEMFVTPDRGSVALCGSSKMQSVEAFTESASSNHENYILINMDNVAERLDSLGISKEEALQRIFSLVPIDERLLDVARDDALIPINDVMIGIFSWTNRENITCNRLAMVAADAPQEQLHLWLTLLNSYNYLAASKYRNLQRPADPAFEHELKTAVAAFESGIENLLGNSDTLVRLGFRRLLPYVVRVETEFVEASDRLLRRDYRGVVLALETALTHYHAVVSGIQPPMT
jgi:hypothetical protein